ncbi:curli production assembly/transport protein CsgE [Vibrio sp. SCSIO 43136]|uniref:curli production assembly/transport protein CsgE n=1 Tax=Vibrio sp. SCSIO 43136 TaxID=2819101 RepID=UPI0020757C92|nr:curli production assembly/transport protein CsgE [Vibrio sp. SCSIO 43136]USD67150.1 curli production assembly/transport protein CsgE [Vibrio sp. SCSIO 43136]
MGLRARFFAVAVCAVVAFTEASFAATKSTGVEESKPLENGPALEDKSAPAFHDFTEVGGLIIDRTMTRLGEDFYDAFTLKMNEKYDSLSENLTVKERATALSGSIISVTHRNKIIYRTALSPGRRQAEEKADQALRSVSAHIIRWEAERLFQDTFDLDHDEI